MTIDTGDTVFHRPTGQTWLVACVDDSHVYWLGWPPGRAQLADCELREKATAEDRMMWLLDLAKPARDDSDDRTRIARQQLGHNTRNQPDKPR